MAETNLTKTEERLEFLQDKSDKLNLLKLESSKFLASALAKSNRAKDSLKNLQALNRGLDSQVDRINNEINEQAVSWVKKRETLESEVYKYEMVPDITDKIFELEDKLKYINRELEIEGKKDVTSKELSFRDRLVLEDKENNTKFENFVKPLYNDAIVERKLAEENLIKKRIDATKVISTGQSNIQNLIEKIQKINEEIREDEISHKEFEIITKELNEENKMTQNQLIEIKNKDLEVKRFEVIATNCLKELNSQSDNFGRLKNEKYEPFLDRMKSQISEQVESDNLQLLEIEKKIIQAEINLTLTKDKNKTLCKNISNIDDTFNQTAMSAESLNAKANKLSIFNNTLGREKLIKSIEILKLYKNIKIENEDNIKFIEGWENDQNLEEFKSKMESEVNRIDRHLEKLWNPGKEF